MKINSTLFCSAQPDAERQLPQIIWHRSTSVQLLEWTSFLTTGRNATILLQKRQQIICSRGRRNIRSLLLN